MNAQPTQPVLATPIKKAPTHSGGVPFNLPNALTTVRILCIPFIVALLLAGREKASANVWAVSIFTLACLTDLADGLIARHTKSVTRLGRILDPVADKLLVLAAVLMLVYRLELNVILAILLLGREITISGLRSFASGEGITIHSTRSGKTKTFLENFGLGFLMVGKQMNFWGVNWFHVGQFLIYCAVGLALWSGFTYFRTYVRELNSRNSA